MAHHCAYASVCGGSGDLICPGCRRSKPCAGCVDCINGAADLLQLLVQEGAITPEAARRARPTVHAFIQRLKGGTHV